MGDLLLRAAPLVLLAAACATTPGATRPPEGADGRWLYERACGRCHALFMPASFTAGEWEFFVRKYGRKARLDALERARVQAYLSKHARGAA